MRELANTVVYLPPPNPQQTVLLLPNQQQQPPSTQCNFLAKNCCLFSCGILVAIVLYVIVIFIMAKFSVDWKIHIQFTMWYIAFSVLLFAGLAVWRWCVGCKAAVQ